MSQWSWYTRGFEGEARFTELRPREVFEEYARADAPAGEAEPAPARRRYGYAAGFRVPEAAIPASEQGAPVPYRGVENRGPRSYRRPDMRILDEVAERLAADPYVDATDMEISVSEGEVVLSGTVLE